MALPSTGPLSLENIGQELGSFPPYSLRNMSEVAGKSTPDAVSEFYGFASNPFTPAFYYAIVNKVSRSGVHPSYGVRNIVDGNAWVLYQKEDAAFTTIDNYFYMAEYAGDALYTAGGLLYVYGNSRCITNVTVTRGTNAYIYTVGANNRGNQHYIDIVSQYVPPFNKGGLELDPGA
jgi:hypothetical protein